ncbi:MAG: hypothetical protein ACRC92_04205 [Peptostreptococcaceae bacterium]
MILDVGQVVRVVGDNGQLVCGVVLKRTAKYDETEVVTLDNQFQPQVTKVVRSASYEIGWLSQVQLPTGVVNKVSSRQEVTHELIQQRQGAIVSGVSWVY